MPPERTEGTNTPSTHYRTRAAAIRRLAEAVQDSQERGRFLDFAAEYENLANYAQAAQTFAEVATLPLNDEPRLKRIPARWLSFDRLSVFVSRCYRMLMGSRAPESTNLRNEPIKLAAYTLTRGPAASNRASGKTAAPFDNRDDGTGTG